MIFILKRFILFWVTKMEKDLNLMKTMRCCGHILYHHFSINEAQNKLVFLLYRHGEMNQNDLLKRLDIKSSSLSELVTKVEKNGYITKEKLLEDKRNVILKLTPLGVSKAKEFELQREKDAELLFKELNEEEKEKLQELLDKTLVSWKKILEERK